MGGIGFDWLVTRYTHTYVLITCSTDSFTLLEGWIYKYGVGNMCLMVGENGSTVQMAY